MNLYDIVIKLTGPIDPLGESNADEKRYENLKEQINLVEKLLCDIRYVANNADRHEASVKRAGDKARNFFISLKEDIENDSIFDRDMNDEKNTN